MFNLADFKSYLSKTGTLPTNRFAVEIPVPKVLFGAEVVVNNWRRPMPGFSEDLQFRAESITAPGVTLDMTNVNRYGIGPIQKFPFNANFTPVSITFLADKDSLVWIFFYNWLNNIFSYSYDDANPNADFLRYRANYMVDYVVDPKINVYDYDGVLSTTIQLIDAYPISMNEVNLSWSDNNQLMHITVSFAYRHWVITNAVMADNSTKSAGVPLLSIPQRSEILQTTKTSSNTFTNSLNEKVFTGGAGATQGNRNKAIITINNPK